ncbi:MAG: alpha-amylase family glycosyl hydrolase [Caldilineaceae bacterium]
MTETSTPQPQTNVMDDFVFGGIEADEQQLLADARNLWRGIRHQYAIEPLDPQPDEPVTVTVFVGPDVTVDQVCLYVTVDGSEPVGSRGMADNGFVAPLRLVETRWEPLIWGYVEVWQGQIPAQPEATLVQYRIEGWHSGSANAHTFWSREPNLDRTVERPTLYGYSVDRLVVPAWAHEAIVYHIFVDRFTGVENRWLTLDELNQFMGGTLRCVLQKLDYIANLGATVIWLSPIFKTPTYHGYDTTDYYTIDPRFGTNEDLRALVTAAHAKGLRVLLDFVANHTSVEFAPFVEAQKNPIISYREWFDFDEQHPHGYRAFFNVASMPQLATDKRVVRNFLIEAACYWLTEYDVDGYRLDYAAGPSHAFWSEFRVACRRAKVDCWLFGEVTLAGARLRTYTGRLDGCLDFAFARSVRQLCSGAQPKITLGQFLNEITRSHHFFALNNFSLPSFLDNHDMNRFLWVANNDKERLRFAVGLLFALGGPPIIYYGTEVGLSQPRSKGPWREEARHPMLWGDAQDADLLLYFRQIIEFRKTNPALIYGDMRILALDDERGIAVVERVYCQNRVVIVVNTSNWAQNLHFSALLTNADRVVSAKQPIAAARETPENQIVRFTPRVVSVLGVDQAKVSDFWANFTLDTGENYDRMELPSMSLAIGYIE